MLMNGVGMSTVAITASAVTVAAVGATAATTARWIVGTTTMPTAGTTS